MRESKFQVTALVPNSRYISFTVS